MVTFSQEGGGFSMLQDYISKKTRNTTKYLW